jgi:hypothetical protein
MSTSRFIKRNRNILSNINYLQLLTVFCFIGVFTNYFISYLSFLLKVSKKKTPQKHMITRRKITVSLDLYNKLIHFKIDVSSLINKLHIFLL